MKKIDVSLLTISLLCMIFEGCQPDQSNFTYR